MAENTNKTAEDIIKDTPGYDKSVHTNLPAATTSSKETPTNKEADNAATLSFVLGLIAVIGGLSGIISLILGIIGIMQANKAKKLGLEGGMQLAGMIFSIIGTVMGGLSLITIIAIMLISGATFLGVFAFIFAGS